ncbi:MAG: hypothetical protein ACRDXD_13370 [Acidimicrobiia bacterium]
MTWVVTTLILVSCTSPHLTESKEYQDLLVRLEQAEQDLGAAQEQARSATERAELRVEHLERRITGLEKELAASREAAAQAQTLADELGYRHDPARYARTHALVNTCERAISGGPGTGNWRENAVVQGSLAFIGLADSDPRKWVALDRPHQGRYEAIKSPVTLEAGATVTVVVPDSERTSLALLYDPEARGSGMYSVEEGQGAVTFQACEGRETAWAGGFVVAGRRCTTIDLYFEDIDEPSGVVISFGAGDCP